MIVLALLAIANKFYTNGNDRRAAVCERIGTLGLLAVMCLSAVLWYLDSSYTYSAEAAVAALENCDYDCAQWREQYTYSTGMASWCDAFWYVLLVI